MIQANELRIGNLFKIQTSSCGFHTIKINGITVDGAVNPSLKEKNCDCTVEDLEPIPLTPEILESCGFEYDGVCYEKNKVSLGHYKSGFFLEVVLHKLTPKIEYLHQLQNLYFALTGEELKINLNVAAH